MSSILQKTLQQLLVVAIFILYDHHNLINIRNDVVVDAFIVSSSTILRTNSILTTTMSSSSSSKLMFQQQDPYMNNRNENNQYTRNIQQLSLSSSESLTTQDDEEVESTTISTSTKSKEEIYMEMEQCLVILNEAAETKQVDSDVVYDALVRLEQLSRKYKMTNTLYSESMLQNYLTGSWQLIFTTGTMKTQKELLKGNKINYFPIKAIQTFDATTGIITNGIYIGNFIVLQFIGNFIFDTMKSRLEFDFNEIKLFQTLTISLQSGQAAEIGAASGLGAESNVVNIKKEQKKLPFFNWISADTTIATARGGGGGLALWKRV
jgi:hypothetical protein